VSAAASNGRPVRLTPQQTRERLEQDAASLLTFVDADGNVVDSNGLVVSVPQPVAPPPVNLPVAYTAKEIEIRCEGDAVAFAIQLEHQRERRELGVQLASDRATLASLRRRRDVKQLELDAAVKKQDEFVQSLPRRVRRVLKRRWGRLVKWVPWAMWGADTMFISRAYGLFGDVPLPFSASIGVSNFTQLLRAGLVSFGLVFGVRLLGAKLRDLVEELRDRRAWVGLVADAGVGALVFAGAVRLAESAAQMQQALLQIESGGSNLTLPTSMLFSIVAFLASVSLACGFYLSEPEADEAADHEHRVEEKTVAADEAAQACFTQLGVARATRAQLRSLDEEETLALAENQAHTDQRVWALKRGNVPVYGLQPAPATTPDASIDGATP
jgi:TRAP-type C4-dicarboxylate transport system permease small subunit